MNSNENNNYVRTMYPVLLLMRITGIIPISLKMEGTYNSIYVTQQLPGIVIQRKFSVTLWYNFKSTLISIVGLTVFVWNFIRNTSLMYEYFVLSFQHNFDLKIIVVIVPILLSKLVIFLIPVTLWMKLLHLRNHWSKWKRFQDEYETILNQDLNSKFNNKFMWTAVKSVGSVIFTNLITQIHFDVRKGYASRISHVFDISFISFIMTYWLSSCTYVRLIAQEINLDAKECIQDGRNGQKLKKFAILWLSSYDLLKEFVEVHSLLFSIFFLEVMSCAIFVTYICLNYSYFSKLVNHWIVLFIFLISVFMIFVICETLHYVHEQVYDKQKEMILEQNTWKMDRTMLQPMSRFLDTISMKNPSITSNGGTPIDRSFFPHALAIIINHMIILRQFQP